LQSGTKFVFYFATRVKKSLKMSWDGYIDTVCDRSGGHCDKACILGQDGSQWTTNGHAKALQITAAEVGTISKAMKSGDDGTFQASGILVEGVKYQFLRRMDNVVLGKKKEHGAITLQTSGSAVVIGHTKEGSQQGETNKGVGFVADYLVSVNM